MCVCIDQARDQELRFTVDDIVLRALVDFTDLHDPSVNYPDGGVAEDSSLKVLGRYPFAILQEESDQQPPVLSILTEPRLCSLGF